MLSNKLAVNIGRAITVALCGIGFYTGNEWWLLFAMLQMAILLVNFIVRSDQDGIFNSFLGILMLAAAFGLTKTTSHLGWAVVAVFMAIVTLAILGLCVGCWLRLQLVLIWARIKKA